MNDEQIEELSRHIAEEVKQKSHKLDLTELIYDAIIGFVGDGVLEIE